MLTQDNDNDNDNDNDSGNGNYNNCNGNGNNNTCIAYGALESAGCQGRPCSFSIAGGSSDSSPTDHLHSSRQCIGKCGMPEKALQLFDSMRQQRLEPN